MNDQPSKPNDLIQLKQGAFVLLHISSCPVLAAIMLLVPEATGDAAIARSWFLTLLLPIASLSGLHSLYTYRWFQARRSNAGRAGHLAASLIVTPAAAIVLSYCLLETHFFLLRLGTSVP